MGNIVKFLVVIIIIAIGASVAYSMMWGKEGKEESDKTVTIGFIGPLTGDSVSYGEPISNAIRLAVDSINKEGGINGAMLKVVYEDGKCTGTDAVNAAQKLVNVDQVVAIIGGVCSGETLSFLPITEQAEVLVLSPSSTSPDLSGAGRYFFRNAPSDDNGGAFLASVIRGDHETVAVISENTEYAQALAGVFLNQFAAEGGNVVADESFDPGTADFRSILTKIKEANPTAIFINPQTELAGGAIVKQIIELGIESQMYGSNLLSGSKAIEIAGDNSEGLIYFDAPGLNSGNTIAQQFLTDYQARFGDLNLEFYLGAAYDAVHIIAHGLQQVGPDRAALRDYMKGIRHDGVIGSYSFDDFGDPVGIDPILKIIRNGEGVPL